MDDVSNIDVVILCGGSGTRLRSVVADRAKPMADIGGRPFLVMLVEHLATFGFRRFILCTGFKAETIEAHFEPVEPACEIVFSRETEPLGTAGALRLARGFLHSDVFLVLNGDSFCPVDYRRLLQSHEENRARATLALTRIPDSRDYGQVAVGSNGEIQQFMEKSQSSGEGWINAGIYVFGDQVLDLIPPTGASSLERQVFPTLASAGLFAFETDGELLDIGTPERYEIARRRLVELMGSGRRDGKGCKPGGGA